jgi:hypothetical protein
MNQLSVIPLPMLPPPTTSRFRCNFVNRSWVYLSTIRVICHIIWVILRWCSGSTTSRLLVDLGSIPCRRDFLFLCFAVLARELEDASNIGFSRLCFRTAPSSWLAEEVECDSAVLCTSNLLLTGATGWVS